MLGFGVLCDGQVTEFNAVALGESSVLGVIRDDDGHLNPQLSSLHPEQQIIQTMPNLRHHNHNPRLLHDRTNLIVHLILGSELIEGLGQVGGVRLFNGAEVHAHEEALGGWVGELLEIKDVVLAFGEDACYGVDDAGLVRAGEGEDVVVGHVER